MACINFDAIRNLIVRPDHPDRYALGVSKAKMFRSSKAARVTASDQDLAFLQRLTIIQFDLCADRIWVGARLN